MPQTQINFDWKWGAISIVFLQVIMFIVAGVFMASQSMCYTRMESALEASTNSNTTLANEVKELKDKLGRHGGQGAAP